MSCIGYIAEITVETFFQKEHVLPVWPILRMEEKRIRNLTAQFVRFMVVRK